MVELPTNDFMVLLGNGSVRPSQGCTYEISSGTARVTQSIPNSILVRFDVGYEIGESSLIYKDNEIDRDAVDDSYVPGGKFAYKGTFS